MNKIKLISDILTQLKSKSTIQGTLTAEGTSSSGSFTLTKEINNDTFNKHHNHMSGCRRRYMGKAFMNHSGHNVEEGKTLGFKERLTLLSTAFEMLNALETTTLSDGNILLQLSSENIPEKVIEQLKERIHAHHQLNDKDCINEASFHKHLNHMNNKKIDLSMKVNDKREILSLDIHAYDTIEQEPSELKAYLQFA